MSQRRVETGIQSLDRDLTVLQGFLESLAAPPQLSTSQESFSLKELLAIVPKAALDSASALSDEEQFEELKEASRPESVPELEKLRLEVETKLGAFLRDERVIAATEQSDEAEVSNADEEINSPTSLGAIPLLAQAPNNLEPILRIFIRHKQRVIADMTIDWDDLAFLSEGLLDYLLKHLEATKPLFDGKHARLSKYMKRKVLTQLDEIKEKAGKARDLIAK